jgi:hypothetical protein
MKRVAKRVLTLIFRLKLGGAANAQPSCLEHKGDDNEDA